MKIIIIFILCLIVNNSFTQLTITTNNRLIINHGDIVLYLSDDTCTMVSKHIIKYQDFIKLDSDRDNRWFQDTYKGKYIKARYSKTGYDLGHLTPSHITSYDDTLNHNSFSMFNAAPQSRNFNEHIWEHLEMQVEDTIAKYKSDAVIITGVIYDISSNYLPNSKIKIPSHYYKIIKINNLTYCWIGDNITEIITLTDLTKLNFIFIKNKMNLIIK